MPAGLTEVRQSLSPPRYASREFIYFVLTSTNFRSYKACASEPRHRVWSEPGLLELGWASDAALRLRDDSVQDDCRCERAIQVYQAQVMMTASLLLYILK